MSKKNMLTNKILIYASPSNLTDTNLETPFCYHQRIYLILF